MTTKVRTTGSTPATSSDPLASSGQAPRSARDDVLPRLGMTLRWPTAVQAPLRPCAIALRPFPDHQRPDDGKYSRDLLRSLAPLGMTFSGGSG